MIVPDLNLLIFACDSGSPQHAAAYDWWADALSGTSSVGLTHPVLFGFVSITTNARVFANPMSLDEAQGHVARWLERPVTQLLTEGRSHCEDVMRLLAAAGTAGGNLVTDAQIAALARAYRGIVHTADRDFLRFEGVECRFPLD